VFTSIHFLRQITIHDIDLKGKVNFFNSEFAGVTGAIKASLARELKTNAGNAFSEATPHHIQAVMAFRVHKYLSLSSSTSKKGNPKKQIQQIVSKIMNRLWESKPSSVCVNDGEGQWIADIFSQERSKYPKMFAKYPPEDLNSSSSLLGGFDGREGLLSTRERKDLDGESKEEGELW